MEPRNKSSYVPKNHNEVLIWIEFQITLDDIRLLPETFDCPQEEGGYGDKS